MDFRTRTSLAIVLVCHALPILSLVKRVPMTCLIVNVQRVTQGLMGACVLRVAPIISNPLLAQQRAVLVLVIQ